MSDDLANVSLRELSEHITKWRKDRKEQFIPGSFNDHNYLIGELRGCVGDINELMSILVGTLNRLTEAGDVHIGGATPGEIMTPAQASQKRKQHESSLPIQATQEEINKRRAEL